MPPTRPSVQTHSDLLHRSPFITYTGSWLTLASHHSWVPDLSLDSGPSGASEGSDSEHSDHSEHPEPGRFSFAFDGTDFAVYGGWDGDTAAKIDIDGNSTWWQAEHAPASAPAPEGRIMYRETVPPGFHRVSFTMSSGRMDLVKVVVGDGPIGDDACWEWWHVALGASAVLLAAIRISRRRRTTELNPTSEKA
ncbi:hypothetical protein CspeluHIS016_0203290 [Cutaneotrichosporon spelunceum]|uniref:Uncharacterized protein n=1 Tax=Cutaneotrichosporon spelunceum TaxID=1672016 RepID=A0AAD3TQW0_9TREE|nr:hypothetical protein CspeluHIS016_0203290 [Cutaneotrichosporon spelunceum]